MNAFQGSVAFAGEKLKILTFNVMCNFCGNKEQNARYEERLAGVADTILRHTPDLVSIQELWISSDVSKIGKLLNDQYEPVYANAFLLSYADPTLLIRKSRFKIIERDGIWFGPRSPGFSFGWKWSFPRRLEWVTLEDSTSKQRFIFAGAHLDNRFENKNPSVDQFIEKLSGLELPLIFAGDMNLWPALPAYEKIKSVFRDSYFESTEHPYFSNGASINTDACNLTKAPVFPDCRVDHVLLSKKAPWKVKAWGVDTYKYFGGTVFLSDHRAVIVELESESKKNP